MTSPELHFYVDAETGQEVTDPARLQAYEDAITHRNDPGSRRDVHAVHIHETDVPPEMPAFGTAACAHWMYRRKEPGPITADPPLIEVDVFTVKPLPGLAPAAPVDGRLCEIQYCKRPVEDL